MEKSVEESYYIKTEIISHILEALITSSTKHEALTIALHEIVRAPWLPIKAKGGIFLKIENEEKIKLTTYTSNFSSELLNLCDVIDYGYCLCGRAAKLKEIIFADCVEDDHDVRFDAMTPHGHYNVPFTDKDNNLLGVVVLYVSHGHKSKDYEVEFLKVIGNILSIICQRFDQEKINKDLERYAMAKTMITTLSHEINNPLAIAVGNCHLLEKALPENKHLKKIQESLDRVHKIVKKIDTIIEANEVEEENYASSNKTTLIKTN